MTERSGAQRALTILASLHVEILLLVFCGVIFLGTARTEGPVFDVVGPDLLPTVAAAIVAALVIVQMVVQVMRSVRGPLPAIRIDPAAVRNAAVFTAATALFVVAVARGWLPFAAATCVFMAINTMLLSNRLHWRDAAIGAASGLALGIVLQFTFTYVLFVDLPG